MKLSSILAAMGFLVIGCAFIFLIMSIFSDDSSAGLSIVVCVLIIFNGFIAVGISELLEKAEKTER
ncbi:hypothetical protein ACFO0S_14675 [Chryseomicrobium palamuruense]|uniref:Lipoprotein n=1 Tax=Chryseomicrobium palamuruense TaxID=682973 RepID=A0ABV8UYA0_9BACL